LGCVFHQCFSWGLNPADSGASPRY
jgi:hypothetical protein